jgi:hypothetical protein
MLQRYPAPLSNPDNSAEKQEAYCKGLETLTDDGLLGEAQKKIWLSGFANNNPRSCYHWQADACYDEAQRRAKPEIYKNAYDAVLREVS